MAKTLYVCSQCGYETSKWMGRCPGCNAWNTFEEQEVLPQPKSRKAALDGQKTIRDSEIFRIDEIDTTDEIRYYTGVSELDRVLGGGIVKGSLVLLGGDPGIGKSTLLLQICEYLGKQLSILYVSGEESVRQLKLRAGRLGVNSGGLFVVSNTDIEAVANTIVAQKPDIVMIDSIQTMSLSALNSSPGSVTQVRECTNLLLRVAKGENIPIFIVGHVNKDGAIAGPKVLEHIVDAVLYFEGERSLSYRILRAVKNRYGSTNEIGVFEMRDTGLCEVTNPSMMLLSGRPEGVSGTCIACVMEGSRPILVDIQALAAKTSFGTPRRTAAGFDYNRMSLILAVLEKRAGYFFGNLDAYLNVVGGLRLDEPAADLPAAISLVSSLRDKAVPDGLVAFGEIGLAGEIRSVSHAAARIKEADRLGFTTCIVPAQALKQVSGLNRLGIRVVGVSDLKQAFAALE